MFQIPKLARTGIINSHDVIALIGEKKCSFKLDKHYVIYNRTKKKRIKKKCQNKSLILSAKSYFEKIDLSDIKILVNGKELIKDE